MQELASLGSFGNNPQNIYEQMVASRSPSTYVAGFPALATKVSSRYLRLSSCRGQFWEERDLLDPKAGNKLLQWKVAMTHPNFSH